MRRPDPRAPEGVSFNAASTGAIIYAGISYGVEHHADRTDERWLLKDMDRAASALHGASLYCQCNIEQDEVWLAYLCETVRSLECEQKKARQ